MFVRKIYCTDQKRISYERMMSDLESGWARQSCEGNATRVHEARFRLQHKKGSSKRDKEKSGKRKCERQVIQEIKSGGQVGKRP